MGKAGERFAATTHLEITPKCCTRPALRSSAGREQQNFLHFSCFFITGI